MKMKELFKKRKFAAGCVTAALAVIIAGTMMMQDSGKSLELPSYTDPLMEISIEEEETPLASAPKVSSDTSKKSSKKKVKMKKAATKSYTKRLPATKKKSSKTSTQNGVTVKTDTSVLTNVTEQYTKKSKYKMVTTNVVTTVTTTTFGQVEVPQGGGGISRPSDDGQAGSSTPSTPSKYDTTAAKAAPRMDSRVISAFDKLGFTMKVDSTVSYAGHFDAKTRTIILRKEDETSYHELGHFLAFITGNADKSSAFTAVYNQEKSKYTGINKAYATQNSSEYFAESVKDYMVNAAVLRSSRPLTYGAIEDALNKVTDAQISKILKIYGPIWK